MAHNVEREDRTAQEVSQEERGRKVVEHDLMRHFLEEKSRWRITTFIHCSVDDPLSDRLGSRHTHSVFIPFFCLVIWASEGVN